ncbi:MAG: dTMP kinase [Planctomycetes bacterium]|nr:dTMP kinase [Planctomycetota bacterium]
MAAKFIVIDGPDGCGKSTQAKLLAGYLKKKHFKVLNLREPGGTPISEKIRRILLDPANSRMTVPTELFLYMASRAQLVDEVIKPALDKGVIVICGRFLSSTIVYQGIAGGIGRKLVEDMGRIATQGTVPDLTIILDIHPEKGLKRKKTKPDRMEKKEIAFHAKVRKGFLKLAKENPARYKVIPSTGSINSIHQKIISLVGIG